MINAAEDDDGDQAPGWDAIDTALERLYGNQQPKHYGTVLPGMLGGKDPLDGISVYFNPVPRPHWHYVTYGFSELYQKESDDADVSGYGFELTFRLATTADATTPPAWPLNFLQNLARYVFRSGNVFDDGHWMTANGPIALESDTRICSMGFATDPTLPALATPHGKVTFLQVVGLTADEETAAKRWQTRQLLDLFLPQMPLWITDLARDSLLTHPDIAAHVTEGTMRDGASQGHLFTDVLQIETTRRLLRQPLIEVLLGAAQVATLLDLLPLRLPFGRSFTVAGGAARLLFEPAQADAATAGEGKLVIALTPQSLQQLMAVLKAKEGVYPVPGLANLQIKVQKTVIKDPDGNPVSSMG